MSWGNLSRRKNALPRDDREAAGLRGSPLCLPGTREVEQTRGNVLDAVRRGRFRFGVMPWSSKPAGKLPHPTHAQVIERIGGLRVLPRKSSRRFRENREQYRIEPRTIQHAPRDAAAHAERSAIPRGAGLAQMKTPNRERSGVWYWWPESESNQRHADFQSPSPRKTTIKSVDC